MVLRATPIQVMATVMNPPPNQQYLCLRNVSVCIHQIKGLPLSWMNAIILYHGNTRFPSLQVDRYHPTFKK